MPINTLHPEYQAGLAHWSRARDVLAGEDALKAAGERYLPRLTGQTDESYRAYLVRASFFNATSRTADGYLGLIFRRPPFLTLPSPNTPVGRAVSEFESDVDLLGTTFNSYARNIVREVISVGRAGSLIDWDDAEQRAYISAYDAEEILNWRVERIGGRNLLTLLVLREAAAAGEDVDEYEGRPEEQLRVLRLEPGEETGRTQCVGETWRRTEGEWTLSERTELRRYGQPVPLIPFVFHGPCHSRAAVDKPPLTDLIVVNLDHYRLNADYKHGIHFTALPTPWVTGIAATTNTEFTIGSAKLWVAENPAARFGFLEFKGEGLATFERAMDRDERLLAVLGSRLLEPSKKVGETAQALELRQAGENSVLGAMAVNVSESLTQVLRWVHWWHGSEALPDDVPLERCSVQLNTDFSVKGMTHQELESVVAAWQAGALSREAMVDLFRRGEMLPERGTVGAERG
jgi:hypothetical protein